MKTKVQMWGNSLAVRIPRPFADEIGLESGTPVELTIAENRLIIYPATGNTFSLEELLEAITPENKHDEVDTGAPVGREVW